MKFSEKLTSLMALTATTGAQLSAGTGITKSQISRLKNGERKMPTNLAPVYKIAGFLSTRFNDEYRRQALAEFTADARLTDYAGQSVIANIIFEWLTDATPRGKDAVDRFISGEGDLSDDTKSIKALPFSAGALPEEGGLSIYYKNSGKRQALRDLLTYLDSLEKPCNIRVFIDESYSWLSEDPICNRDMNLIFKKFAERGFSFERIQPPYQDTDSAISSIERWLPCYMHGSVTQYFYPWSRDRLHRKTIFMAPGHIALFTSSLHGETEARFTMLTRNADIVMECDKEFDALVSRCHPTMTVCTADDYETLFLQSEEVAAIKDVGVYKTNLLSISTLPAEIIERLDADGTALSKRMCYSYKRRGVLRSMVLRDNIVTDVMKMPDLQSVLDGKVPVPGTQVLPQGCLYYTPAEFRSHLERILWYLEFYPNYRAVFINDSSFENIIAYVKGNRKAILVKTTPPFTVFNIVEQTMATAFCDYFLRLAESKITADTRKETIELLQREINSLAEYVK